MKKIKWLNNGKLYFINGVFIKVKNEILLLFVLLLGAVFATGCYNPIHQVPIKMNTESQKLITYKWELIYQNDIPIEPGKFITFYQDGSYTSNMTAIEKGYYITIGSALFFYKNKPHEDSTAFYDMSCNYGKKANDGDYLQGQIKDTMSIAYLKNDTWFWNATVDEGGWLHFKKIAQ